VICANLDIDDLLGNVQVNKLPLNPSYSKTFTVYKSENESENKVLNPEEAQ